MSDVVFVLGAGASKNCGAPLMNDFLDAARRLLSTGAVSDKAEHFEGVFRAIGNLQAVHSKAQLDITNIESIFTAFEIANVLGKLPGESADNIPRVIAGLKEVIVKTLEVSIDFPTRRGSVCPPETYEQFAQLVAHLRGAAKPRKTVSVITFNYDIAADLALFQYGLGPDYGLAQKPRTDDPVQLLKLHGSLNWAANETSSEVVPLHLEDYFSKYSLRSWDERGTCKLSLGSHLAEYFETNTDLRVLPEPVIVPPTWNKADYHRALSAVWSAAAKHLSEAAAIYVIGYSLPETDAFFRLLYGLGTVGANPLERFHVYNPDTSGSVDARFRSLLGPGAEARYSYFPERFEHAVGMIKALYPKQDD